MAAKPEDELSTLVKSERRRRGWSQRYAATRGGISNTRWAQIENGQMALTDRVQHAVAEAFGWPHNWPETIEPSVERTLLSRLAVLEEAVAQLQARVNDHPVAAPARPAPPASRRARPKATA